MLDNYTLFYYFYFNTSIFVSIFIVQLLLCRDHLLDLEKQLETPSEDGRIRVLKGDDPKPDELTAKVEEVIYPVRAWLRVG